MPRALSDELPGMVVGDMMSRWPQTVPVLVRQGMACPGCLMARFMTVHEAAREHGVPPGRLMRELTEAIANPMAAALSPSAHEGAEA